MKIMPCPLNGPRNIQEFICAGPVEPHPDPNQCSDEEWTEFVWMEENLAGVVREWWCHVATSYWFIAERNTVSDEILATYPADRVFSERVEFEPPGAAARGRRGQAGAAEGGRAAAVRNAGSTCRGCTGRNSGEADRARAGAASRACRGRAGNAGGPERHCVGRRCRRRRCLCRRRVHRRGIR